MDMALTEGQKIIGQRPKMQWPKAKNALAEGQKRIGRRPKMHWPKAKAPSSILKLFHMHIFYYILVPAIKFAFRKSGTKM